MYKNFFKRILDLVISTTILIIVSPIFVVLVIGLGVANQGAGVFFLQERPGRHRRIFKVIKFKTMTDQLDANGDLLPDNQRMTKLGKFIRSTSLDELPQLFNVILGDMSLVGPRPLLVKYLSLYDSYQDRRHEVKPGITGWAQVNGRNSISWDKKFELDVYYVENISFMLDLKVIFLTAKKVLMRTGINSSSEAPMETFRGNKS